MEKIEIIRELKTIGILSVDNQSQHKKRTLELFDELMKLEPTIGEFSEAMTGIVLYPEIIYKMTRHGK